MPCASESISWRERLFKWENTHFAGTEIGQSKDCGSSKTSVTQITIGIESAQMHIRARRALTHTHTHTHTHTRTHTYARTHTHARTQARAGNTNCSLYPLLNITLISGGRINTFVDGKSTVPLVKIKDEEESFFLILSTKLC